MSRLTWCWAPIACCGLFLFEAAPLCAQPQMQLLDTVRLKNGGELHGHVREVTENKRTYYVLETPDGEIKLSNQVVGRISRPSEAEREYQRRVADMPDTLEAHEQMQQWCSRQSVLKKQREYHLLRIIELEPDHEDARALLGYEDRQGRWVLRDQFYQNRGYVRDKRGNWRLPEGIAASEREDQIKQAQSDWRNKLKNWRRKMEKGRGHEAADAERKISQATDPLAIDALMSLFEDEKIQKMRLLYLETIGKIPTYEAQKQLTVLAMSSPEQVVRDRCISLLKQPHYNPASIVNSIKPFLNPTPNTPTLQVNQAGFVLGELDHPSAIRPLIDALVTTHIVAMPKSGNMSASFGTDGTGFGTGGDNKPLAANFNNQSVLDALKRLTKGVDFGFDEAAWLNWYVDAISIETNDLRRDN